jgi:hypothetical protein
MFMPNSIYTRTAYWKGGVIVQVCVGADLLVGRLQVAPQDGCTENEINDLLERPVQGFLCRCAATRMHFDIWADDSAADNLPKS